MKMQRRSQTWSWTTSFLRTAMNEYKWAMLGCLLLMIALTLMGLSTVRAQRAQLKRSALPTFVGHFAGWSLFGFFAFSGIFLVVYLTCIAVTYLPLIIWILRLPNDGTSS